MLWCCVLSGVLSECQNVGTQKGRSANLGALGVNDSAEIAMTKNCQNTTHFYHQPCLFATSVRRPASVSDHKEPDQDTPAALETPTPTPTPTPAPAPAPAPAVSYPPIVIDEYALHATSAVRCSPVQSVHAWCAVGAACAQSVQCTMHISMQTSIHRPGSRRSNNQSYCLCIG